MAEVTKGGVTTAGKNAKAAGPKLGDPNALRAKLAEDGQDAGVVFVGNCDHLHLRPPQPIHDQSGNVVGYDNGVYVDFGGVGKTREYNMDLADDAAYVTSMREIIGRKPQHPDVYKYKIRELKPEEPAPPFVRWDEFSADHIKVWLTANLGSDSEANARLVKEAARYEAANENRDDVLAMLDVLLVREASVTDAFDVQIKLR